jgi:hypothetical protein
MRCRARRLEASCFGVLADDLQAAEKADTASVDVRGMMRKSFQCLAKVRTHARLPSAAGAKKPREKR